jgi:hypothetical protein
MILKHSAGLCKLFWPILNSARLWGGLLTSVLNFFRWS